MHEPSRSEQEPSRAQLEALFRQGRFLIRPLERIFRPAISGWENVPDQRPLLFVGNHTLYGVLDVPFLVAALFREKGIVIRGLADRLHFQMPGWKDFLTRCGAVCGSPENCGRLMQQGEAIIVFPGGSREVAKRKGEDYRLLWKQRSGFARLAAEHSCTIVPFASVGIEDMFRILFDGDQILRSPFGKLIEHLQIRLDTLFPFAVGKGPLGLPRFQRLYFHFAPPVEAKGIDPSDPAAVWRLREETRLRIEQSIQDLQQKQAHDPQRYVGLREVLGV